MLGTGDAPEVRVEGEGEEDAVEDKVDGDERDELSADGLPAGDRLGMGVEERGGQAGGEAESAGSWEER